MGARQGGQLVLGDIVAQGPVGDQAGQRVLGGEAGQKGAVHLADVQQDLSVLDIEVGERRFLTGGVPGEMEVAAAALAREGAAEPVQSFQGGIGEGRLLGRGSDLVVKGKGGARREGAGAAADHQIKGQQGRRSDDQQDDSHADGQSGGAAGVGFGWAHRDGLLCNTGKRSAGMVGTSGTFGMQKT